MPTERNNLLLYEAIELRAEYDARIKTLKALLPEGRETRSRFLLHSDEGKRLRPVAAFSVNQAREQLDALEFKRRKLNNAMQRANFDHSVSVYGRDTNLVEALELRKAVNQQVSELATQLAPAAYERVIYKEDRDIVEAPEVDYARVNRELEDKRQLFRALNRALRAAAFQIEVDFKDE